MLLVLSLYWENCEEHISKNNDLETRNPRQVCGSYHAECCVRGKVFHRSREGTIPTHKIWLFKERAVLNLSPVVVFNCIAGM
jgi:hypothetical protein